MSVAVHPVRESPSIEHCRAESLDLADDPALSPREQEIARLVAIGYPNKTIAGILDISPWTVATHVRRIFNKLNVHGRAAMVAELSRTGFRFERPRRHAPFTAANRRDDTVAQVVQETA